MGRYSSNPSYGHWCKPISGDPGFYWIGWTMDRYYEGSRLRHPQSYQRDTDERGARRFCKKWGVAFPEAERQGVKP